mmetsp:Transcript_6360/g.10131  ORF Transcript_6360/g.10131 Transcript_6360/m.10131 type:complete len:325 (+) Transcript_6360:76-1050(+)|eukprot:CAMPEP_0194217686 /NCGR_PEP_ID=MMETSP0156-20130528/21983_1 /TAXON_ID=33649 /ORGANISM="Thalassionema nitzschioides, Strain L26-B" /LENGTH=324 /DNA_ID=CAMNT_0038946801 /DNA_START=73 /DNA_END=1047 /DNA_ORIENTATION=+
MIGLYKLATYLLVLSETSWLTKATYSTVALDSATMQVGGAGAHCVDENIGYFSEPGKGVLHTQGVQPLSPESETVNEFFNQIGTAPPADILATMNTLDSGMELGGPAPDYEFRQNGIADLSPVAAGFTGSALEEGAEEHKNLGLTSKTFAYQVLGTGVSNGTVSYMNLAFNGLYGGKGCDLADRLMITLEAVSVTNNGNLACINEFGTPAAVAFLRVDAADGNIANLVAEGDGTTDPTIELRSKYNAWRTMNPCPVSPTEMPVEAPSNVPVEVPTDAPVDPDTNAPVEDPTDAPTDAPTSGGNVLKQVVLTTVFVTLAVFGVNY